ncbi:hypothetical protein GW17_00043940 [Ensete ventricosum]|nr:hypothetical protein GW17_00043940 [Ensete ventricosum]
MVYGSKCESRDYPEPSTWLECENWFLHPPSPSPFASPPRPPMAGSTSSETPTAYAPPQSPPYSRATQREGRTQSLQ